MIKPYTQKIFFVDQNFLHELRESSMVDYELFVKPEVDTEVICLPVEDEVIDGLLKSVDARDIRVGNVLLKTQYSDQFAPAEEFSESAALNKFLQWQSVCVALGAKSVSVKSVESSQIEAQSTASLDVNLVAGVMGNEFGAGVNHSAAEANDALKRKMITMEVKAAGGPPDLDAAKKIMKANGLDRDSLFLSVYNMRELKSNELLSQSFILDTTGDIKKTFDSSTKAKLSAVAKLYSASVDTSYIKSSLENSKEAVKISVSVEF